MEENQNMSDPSWQSPTQSESIPTKNKALFPAIIVVSSLLIVGGGIFAYQKFFKNESKVIEIAKSGLDNEGDNAMDELEKSRQNKEKQCEDEVNKKGYCLDGNMAYFRRVGSLRSGEIWPLDLAGVKGYRKASEGGQEVVEVNFEYISKNGTVNNYWTVDSIKYVDFEKAWADWKS